MCSSDLSGTFEKVPTYVQDQIELDIPERSLGWRALLVPVDRAGIVIARAFPPRLGWEPATRGAALLLNERFAYRIPGERDLELLTVIR